MSTILNSTVQEGIVPVFADVPETDWQILNLSQATSSSDPNSIIVGTPTTSAGAITFTLTGSAVDTNVLGNGAWYTFRARDILGRTLAVSDAYGYQTYLKLDTVPNLTSSVVIHYGMTDDPDLIPADVYSCGAYFSGSNVVERATRKNGATAQNDVSNTPGTSTPVKYIHGSHFRGGSELFRVLSMVVDSNGTNISGSFAAQTGDINFNANDLHVFIQVGWADNDNALENRRATFTITPLYYLSPRLASGWTP